jgi:signal transduction histidine kinase
VTGVLVTGADPGAALRLVAERARDAAGAPLGAIARPGAEDPGVLVFEAVTSAVGDQDRLTGYTVPVDGSTASGLAFTSGEAVVVRGYGGHVADQQAGTTRPPPAAVTGLDSAVAVPLTVGDETLGVLLVARFTGAPPFNEAEVRLVRRFAVDAALAIEFARAERDRRRLAVLEDRDRIARDLHDLVIQRLFAIGLGLEGVSRAVGPDTADRMAGFVQELDRTIKDVRSAIFSLQERPEQRGSLRSELLRLALDAVPVLGFEPRTGFSGPLDSVVADPVRADLLATLREALSNVARHARATAVDVDVSVDRSGRRLALVVSDDGVGVPPGPGRRSGLANLARRAERWDGGLAVRRGQAGGTTLEWTAQLPVATSGADG